MFEHAVQREVFAPLVNTGLKHRLSMFADDVMIFIKPNAMDLKTCMALLQLFGEASGLRVNMSKSADFPIRYSADDIQTVGQILGYPRGASHASTSACHSCYASMQWPS